MYDHTRARRSIIDTVLFRTLSQMATLSGYILMVRGIHKEDFGVYSLLYSFVPVVSTLASLGLEQTLRRYQPEYLRAGNLDAAAWLVTLVSRARLGANLLIICVLLLAWNHLAPLFQLTPFRNTFALFSLLMLLIFQVQILQMTLASHMLHRYSVGSVAVLSCSKLVLYGTLFVLHAMTLEWVLLADLTGYAIVYLLLRIQYRRVCRHNDVQGGYRPAPEERKRLLAYGIFNNFNDAGTLLLDSKLDNFFIAAIIDPISVGVYAFYTRLGEMAGSWTPLRLFDNVIQPMFFSTRKTDAQQRMPRYFSLLVNLNFIPYWPVLAFSLAYHREIVNVIFGGKFVEHSWLLPLMLGFGLLNSVSVPVTLVAQYEERAALILMSKFTALYNVVAMLLLVPTVGLYGAAIARGSALILKNAFIWWNVRDQAVWGNAAALLSTGVLLWGSVVLACLTLKHALPLPALVQLIIGALICGLGVLLYLRSPALSASDRGLLGSLFRGREARALHRLGVLRQLGGRGAALP